MIMAQRVLVVCHDYHPTPSANTLCVEPIVRHLVGRGVKVDWLCVRSSLSTKRREELDGVVVHRALSMSELFYRLSRRLISARWSVPRLIGMAATVAMRFLYARHVEGYVGAWRRPAVRLGKRLMSSEHYDAMISVSLPVTAHLVASDLKRCHPLVPLVMYQLDPFTYNYVLPSADLERRRELESRYTQAADAVIAARGVLEENHLHGFSPEHTARVVSLELPILLDRIEGTETSVAPAVVSELDPAAINCVYAGAFYGSGVRPVDGIVDLIQRLPPEFAFHILGGSADEALRALDLPASRLRVYGRVDAIRSDGFIDGADILLSVGNNLPNQMPSKLFRYMSTGKPIIHIQYHDSDLCVDLLRRYGRSLILRAETLKDPDVASTVAAYCREERSRPEMHAAEIARRMRGITSTDVVHRIVEILSDVMVERP